MNTDFIKGIVPPIITPMTKDEKLDEMNLRRQVDFMIDGGISGILACGSNGEFYMDLAISGFLHPLEGDVLCDAVGMKSWKPAASCTVRNSPTRRAVMVIPFSFRKASQRR